MRLSYYKTNNTAAIRKIRVRTATGSCRNLTLPLPIASNIACLIYKKAQL